jgi:hypothetical protein
LRCFYYAISRFRLCERWFRLPAAQLLRTYKSIRVLAVLIAARFWARQRAPVPAGGEQPRRARFVTA